MEKTCPLRDFVPFRGQRHHYRAIGVSSGKERDVYSGNFPKASFDAICGLRHEFLPVPIAVVSRSYCKVENASNLLVFDSSANQDIVDVSAGELFNSAYALEHKLAIIYQLAQALSLLSEHRYILGGRVVVVLIIDPITIKIKISPNTAFFKTQTKYQSQEDPSFQLLSSSAVIGKVALLAFLPRNVAEEIEVIARMSVGGIDPDWDDERVAALLDNTTQQMDQTLLQMYPVLVGQDISYIKTFYQFLWSTINLLPEMNHVVRVIKNLIISRGIDPQEWEFKTPMTVVPFPLIDFVLKDIHISFVRNKLRQKKIGRALRATLSTAYTFDVIDFFYRALFFLPPKFQVEMEQLWTASHLGAGSVYHAYTQAQSPGFDREIEEDFLIGDLLQAQNGRATRPYLFDVCENMGDLKEAVNLLFDPRYHFIDPQLWIADRKRRDPSPRNLSTKIEVGNTYSWDIFMGV